MKQIIKIAAFIGIMLLTLIVYTGETNAATQKNIQVNTDGFVTTQTVLIENNRVYVPIRYVSNTFGYTLNGKKLGYPTVIFNGEVNQISVKYDHFRMPSKFIINLNDSDGKDYISMIDLEKGVVSDRIGSYKPIVYNNTTYVNINDLMKAFGGKSSYENNKLYVLYKGRGNNTSMKWYNSARYFDLVKNEANELAEIEGYYDFLGSIFKTASKTPIPTTYKQAFKTLRSGSKLATYSFKKQFDMIVEPFYNDSYLTGMVIERGPLNGIDSVRPQTINDLK